MLNCIFTPDSIWKAEVRWATDAFYTLPNSAEAAITNATVIIATPAGPADTLVHTGDGWYIGHTKPLPGIAYQIKATVPGYGELTAIDSIPQALPDVTATIDTTVMHEMIEPVLLNPTAYYEIQCKIQNASSGSALSSQFIKISLQAYNQYFLENNPVYQDSNFQSFYAFTYDKTLQPVSGGMPFLLFDNSAWSGESRTVPFYCYAKPYGHYWVSEGGDVVPSPIDAPPPAQPNTEPFQISDDIPARVNFFYNYFLTCSVLSPAMYQYQLSYFRQNQQLANPLAEYVNVYSNISGGLGIFAGYQSRKIKIN